MKKYILRTVSLVLAVLFLLFGTINVSALNFNGTSSAGGDGSSTTASSGGYAIPNMIANNSNRAVGYRFTVINNAGGAVTSSIDVFRYSTYTADGIFYAGYYKFDTKRCKTELKSTYTSKSFSTSGTTAGVCHDSDMGLTLPNDTTGVQGWSTDANLGVVLKGLWGYSVSTLENNAWAVLIEPIFPIKLQSVYHALTPTEIAVYGASKFGSASDGNSSSNANSFGFIANYSNRYYPNSLRLTSTYVGLAAAGSLTSRATFASIINNGYGCAIAYAKEVEDTRTDFEQMDDAVTSGMYMKEQLNREGEDFYYMHTLIEITAPDTEILEQRIRQVKNKCASIMMTVRRADYCHEQCFKSMLPLLSIDADIEKQSRRNVLTSGAAAAFPFTSFELCDEKGILFGINLHNNSAVILDNYNSDIYSNGNMSIFGMSGAGKTYTILLMAMRLRMCGVQVFIIAPEKGFEYRSVCEALGGQYIKIARGSTDRINIMEIRRTTLDIDDNMADHKSRNDSVMLDVAQDVKTYLKLRYPSMTPEEGYLLGGAITECYASFGITKDNRSLIKKDGSFKRMPDLSNLYPFLTKIPELKNVAVIVKDLVDSGLAGQTNVDLKSQFIVIDTSSARDEDVSSATFTGTVFIRDELSRSRTKKKAVFGDELWVIAGSDGNEQAADFVIRLIKTIRGYGGIFISATQNVIDYFALREGKFGDSLLNNSRLKLLLQMEEPEALKLKEKIGLSDEEVMQIVRCGRGQGLLCAGSNRIAVEIRSSKTEYDLITTNRADLEKRQKK